MLPNCQPTFSNLVFLLPWDAQSSPVPFSYFCIVNYAICHKILSGKNIHCCLLAFSAFFSLDVEISPLANGKIPSDYDEQSQKLSLEKTYGNILCTTYTIW